MSTITTEQVKELRDATSVSIMQCRKALEEAGGDMEKAMIILRKKGSEVASKKADRSAADGTVVIKTDGSRALILTLNCETDFVARNDDFVTLANKFADIAWNDGVSAAQEQASALINDVVLKIGENIQLGKIEEVSGGVIGAYTHHTGKMGSVVVLEGGSPEIAKDIAMHVAAMKPAYLSADEIPADAREGVVGVIQEELANSDKPEEIKQKMLEGKISAYFKEQTLLDQSFFKNPEKTIAQYAGENNAKILKFMVYTV